MTGKKIIRFHAISNIHESLKQRADTTQSWSQPRSQAFSLLPPFLVGRKTLVAAGNVTTCDTNVRSKTVSLFYSMLPEFTSRYIVRYVKRCFIYYFAKCNS